MPDTRLLRAINTPAEVGCSCQLVVAFERCWGALGRAIFSLSDCPMLKGANAGMCSELGWRRITTTFSPCTSPPINDQFLTIYMKKTDSVPATKASIRLLRYIFANGADVPEFQRQLCIPSVPKFSTTLIFLAEQSEDVSVKVGDSRFSLHLTHARFSVTCNGHIDSPRSDISFSASLTSYQHVHNGIEIPEWLGPKVDASSACRSSVPTIFCLAPNWRKSWRRKSMEEVARRYSRFCVGIIPAVKIVISTARSVASHHFETRLLRILLLSSFYLFRASDSIIKRRPGGSHPSSS